MAIVHYRQRGNAGALQDEMRRFFEQVLGNPDTDADGSNVVTAQWVPQVDIKEEDNRFVLLADLPGIDPADIEVQMDKGILSIKGTRELEGAVQGENGESGRFSRIERRHGSFHRRFALPDSADPEGITANGRNGVLEVSIPKRAESAPRRIQVGGAGSRT